MRSRTWYLTMTALLALAAAGAPAVSMAQRIDGSILLDSCQSRLTRLSGFEGGLCLGVIAGALDAHDALLAKEEALFCLGDRRTTNDQVVRIVVKWLKDNPGQLGRAAGSSVIFAMRDAFPCPVAEPGR